MLYISHPKFHRIGTANNFLFIREILFFLKFDVRKWKIIIRQGHFYHNCNYIVCDCNLIVSWTLCGNVKINPFTPKSDLIDFTLSNTRRFYSSKGDPLGVKGLTQLYQLYQGGIQMLENIHTIISLVMNDYQQTVTYPDNLVLTTELTM